MISESIKQSLHIDPCYQWLRKLGGHQYKDAETIAAMYSMFHNIWEYRITNALAFLIEQDPRFNEYLLKGTDETHDPDTEPEE